MSGKRKEIDKNLLEKIVKESLTCSEAAQKLGVSDHTVKDRIKLFEIDAPHFISGNRTLDIKMRQFNICDKARVKQYLPNLNSSFSEEGEKMRASYMPPLLGHIVVVVDYSDSDGLVYGVVKPNFNGYHSREDVLRVYWVSPEELDTV